MHKRPDGLYQVQKTVVEKGVKKQVYFYGHTQAEVKRKIAEYSEKAARGRDFQSVAEEWKDIYFSSAAYKTTECYAAPYKRIVAAFAPCQIGSITPMQLDVFIRSVASKGYALRTVRAHIEVLNMIFRHAVQYGDMQTNPAASLSPPPGLSVGRRDIPPDDVLERVKNGVRLEFGLFAYMLLYTGLRRGEALALEYEDFDFVNKRIRVTKSLYYENNKVKIKRPKTDAGTRTTILLDCLAEQIDPSASGPVFHNDRGEYLTLSAFQKRWIKYCRAAGLCREETRKRKQRASGKIEDEIVFTPTVTPHQLRHAYATILYEAGIDEKIAQDLLGHASITMTRGLYTHIRKSKKEAAADLLNKYVSL